MVKELPIATSSRFESIVKRAFEKQPPFEGKDKKSDKGFKDALLWESILEFALAHSNSRIIYYSQDNAFGDILLSEFSECENSSSLYICKNKKEVKAQLEIWAKEIDKYSYQPIDNYGENTNIVNWLNSEDFLIQIINCDFGIIEKGRLIIETVAHLISIDNIEQQNENEDTVTFSIDVYLQIEYKFKDGGSTSEMINATVIVDSFDDSVFIIDDVYRTDEPENESED